MYQLHPVHRCNSFLWLNAACPGKKYRESGASGFIAVTNSSGTAPITLRIFDARNTPVFLLLPRTIAILSNRFARRRKQPGRVVIVAFVYRFSYLNSNSKRRRILCRLVTVARNRDTLDATTRSLPRVRLSSDDDNALAIVTTTVNALRTRFPRKSRVKLRSSCVVSFRQKTVHRSAVVGRLARVG